MTELLVQPHELADELGGTTPPTVLDVRWWLRGPPGRDAYLVGHIPGAVFADLDRDLSGPPGAAGRHPLPGAAEFQAAMRALGVRGGRGVVVYDDADAMAAARAWWCLSYFGHPQVRVLDGGYRAWVSAGLPVSAEDVAPVPGDFTADPGQLPALDADGAVAMAREGVLLDARASERYRGEVEPIDPVGGHVPGALSAPTAANRGADGRFLPPDALRERFAALGVDGTRPVGTYCGSGVSAAHQALALRLAGITAALYPGSWSHWTADDTRPVARGAAPG